MNSARLQLSLLGAVCFLAGAPAYAQVGPSSSHSPVQGKSTAPAKEEPPPALPGSRAEATAAAPATKAALDMPPTEALFDAVNRGDLPAAKDALNRGADTNGRNVLGLTPLDLAIDLGRNEITFVLLSLRTPETPSPAAPAPSRVAAATPPATHRGPRRLIAQRQPAPEQQVLVRQAGYSVSARQRSVQQESAAQAPKRFAGDGGSPNPQAGFLGFGPTTR